MCPEKTTKFSKGTETLIVPTFTAAQMQPPSILQNCCGKIDDASVPPEAKINSHDRAL